MTAIAGVWRYSDEATNEDRCRSMLVAQSRHGTGANCSWAMAGLSLGRRLTPTLPEDRHDRGVATSPDGVFRLVADIRIDNRAELGGALGMAPAEAGGRSDAALLMAAWQRWREGALERIVGDFAFAVWDGERLVLARDYPGQRPLFYGRTPDQMAFASMPHGLLALPEIALVADERSLERFARHVRPLNDATYLKSIRQVAPGEIIVFTPGEARHISHWHPPQRPIVFKRDEDYVDAVRETLDRAVSARLRGAESGLACHLSAGFDSAAVTGTAARLHTAARPITAVTVVPHGGYRLSEDGRLADERDLAAATAARYEAIEHVVVERANRSPIQHFETWFDLFLRPVPEVVNEDWFSAANEAASSRGLTVLLHGQSGNVTFSYSGVELLAGFLARGRIDLWWREMRSRARAGMPWRSLASRSLAPFVPRPLWLAMAAGRGRPIRMEDYSLVRRSAASCGRFGARRRGEVDYALQPSHDAAAARARVLAQMDFGTINKGVLAAWGLDLRDPLADRRMIELTFAIPLAQFERDGVARSLARRVLADRVPAELLTERRRGHQGADWLDYLTAYHGDLAVEAKLQASSGATRFLDMDRMQDLIGHWPTDPSDPDATRLYRSALMSALSAGHFARRVAQPG